MKDNTPQPAPLRPGAETELLLQSLDSATPDAPAFIHDREGKVYWPGEPGYEIVMAMRRMDEQAQRKLALCVGLIASGKLSAETVMAMTDDERRAYVMALPETDPGTQLSGGAQPTKRRDLETDPAPGLETDPTPPKEGQGVTP